MSLATKIQSQRTVENTWFSFSDLACMEPLQQPLGPSQFAWPWWFVAIPSQQLFHCPWQLAAHYPWCLQCPCGGGGQFDCPPSHCPKCPQCPSGGIHYACLSINFHCCPPYSGGGPPCALGMQYFSACYGLQLSTPL